MKLRKGLTWKSIEDISKGKEFTVVEVKQDTVIYKSVETGNLYEESRKNFEKRMKNVSEYWSKTNKDYKRKKERLKGE